MMNRHWGWAVALVALATGAGQAVAAPCGTGTLNIVATSDTPLVGQAYNVGQRAQFSTSLSAGLSASSHSWTIPGPYLKDYQEGLNTAGLPATPAAWTPIPLVAADLLQPTVSLYWKPSAAQTHPNTGGPETRTVSVTVNLTGGGGTCTASLNVTVERNLTDSNRQPEDYYTSTHRQSGADPGYGAVIDEHRYWHVFVQGGAPGSWLQFLAWHGYFLGRFDLWRAEFGYPPVAPWYPGRPLPTGPEFDQAPSLRQVFDPDSNRMPTYLTLAGGTDHDPHFPPIPGIKGLADYASLDDFSDSFEGKLGPPIAYHGQIHCNIGSLAGLFSATSGTGFGSMCKSSSPKDPMFWRWHGFIDRLYRNYCAIKSLSCHIPATAGSDPWMGDNATDIGNVGVPPSPPLHFVSPDIWNRRNPETSDTCIPRTNPPHLNTVGGVTRNCGSEADHENPESGKNNYLYATLRNNGSAPVENVYAEVAVYIADASTGLSWPADFQMLPETRQFITLNLKPNQVTAIGPLPWTAPSNATSDHWCLYIRILTVQEAPLVEGNLVWANVANSNSIAWRNIKVVNPGQQKISRFIVRNIRREAEALDLTFDAAPALMRGGRIVLQLDPALQRALVQGPLPDGVKALGRGRYALTGLRTRIEGLRLPPRGQGVAQITLEGVPDGATGDVVVTQASRAGVDGGVVLRVAGRRRR